MKDFFRRFFTSENDVPPENQVSQRIEILKKAQRDGLENALRRNKVSIAFSTSLPGIRHAIDTGYFPWGVVPLINIGAKPQDFHTDLLKQCEIAAEREKLAQKLLMDFSDMAQMDLATKIFKAGARIRHFPHIHTEDFLPYVPVVQRHLSSLGNSASDTEDATLEFIISALNECGTIYTRHDNSFPKNGAIIGLSRDQIGIVRGYTQTGPDLGIVNLNQIPALNTGVIGITAFGIEAEFIQNVDPKNYSTTR